MLPVLVALNVLVFIAQSAVEIHEPGFVHDYLAISHRGVSDAYAWQFLTAMFLHVGVWHFVGNLLLLYLLGRDLESILGRRHFLYLYLAGAIGGELGHLFLMPVNSVLFAASGGTAAVVFAYATILPELELVSAKARGLHLKAKHLAWAALGLTVILLCVDRTREVAHSAFLGGCVAGLLYAHLLGFGRPSFLQRLVQRQRERIERYERMTIDQLVSDEIDPLLEKISRHGFAKLSRRDRRDLLRARARILEKERAA